MGIPMDEVLRVRLPGAIREAVLTLAVEEGRTASDMVRRLIGEALAVRGSGPPDLSRRQARELPLAAFNTHPLHEAITPEAPVEALAHRHRRGPEPVRVEFVSGRRVKIFACKDCGEELP